MDDAQLRTQLALGAGGIHLTETVLPKTAAHREQRIVFENGGTILGAFRETGALKVTGNFAGMGIKQAANLRHARGLLLQEHFPRYGLDLNVGQRDTDGKTVEKLVEERDIGERALTGPDDNHLAVELLGHGFGNLGDEGRANV